jgi:hypothetical protein
MLLAILPLLDRLWGMKLPTIVLTCAVSLVCGLLSAAEIKWPKDSFTTETHANAVERAKKDNLPIAYIVMYRGEKPERAERRNRDKDAPDPRAAYDLTEDFAKDCARFAVVVNVTPEELQKEGAPFSNGVMKGFSETLGAGFIPVVVIADPTGQFVYAQGNATEMRDDARRLIRDARENHKTGKIIPDDKPEKDDGKDED